MTDQATPAKVRLTDGLGPLPEAALQAVAQKIGNQCAVWEGIGARDVEAVLREAARLGLVDRMTTTETLTREEWMRRYAARVIEGASWDERPAMMAAQAAAESEERDASEEGRAVEWKDPEGAADSEMSYWTDDGDD